MALTRPHNILEWASAFRNGLPISTTAVNSPFAPGSNTVIVGDFVALSIDGTRRGDWLKQEPINIARVAGLVNHPTYGIIIRLAWLFRQGELHDENVSNALGRIYAAQCAPSELHSSTVETYDHAAMILYVLPVVPFISHTISFPIIDANTLFTREDTPFARSDSGYFLPIHLLNYLPI
ncbi:hypothetical protein BD414DRAFT_541086 [Trametes punicea]|nr:hypothetical protein BD414DRAFT_541086 [Trametes punicea]